MKLGIYPSIGIARVGNALDSFVIGPELPRGPFLELNSGGHATPVEHFKFDTDEIKRQAARFRIIEIHDDGTSTGLALPAGDRVEWTVHLVNKKAGIKRPASPPGQPNKPQLLPNPAGLVIDPGPRTVVGPNATAAKFDTGEFQGRRVPLGEIRTDASQGLLVMGGFGFSSSPTNKPLPSFYTNPGWHDDVSDGPVRARIVRSNGSVIDDVAPAWVVVSTPDYAPEIQGLVTLYDVIRQVGIDHHGLAAPSQVLFSRDVFPILERTRKLQWVHLDPNWQQIPDDWAALADPGGEQALRAGLAQVVRESQSILNRFNLTALQDGFLEQWVAGTFTNDWTGIPGVAPLSAENLTQAALESAVGQGFFPGIEAGILVKNPTIYTQNPFDFRVDHAQLSAGDLTALMAVPWQADFEDCEGSWWPSQRPDDVLERPDATTPSDWSRGIAGRIGMVNNFAKLAFITPQRDSAGKIVFAESQRAKPESFT